jgi:hypothetical protein
MTPVLLLMTGHVTLFLVSYLDVLTHQLVTMTHLQITTTDHVLTLLHLTIVTEVASMTPTETAFVMNMKFRDVRTATHVTMLQVRLTMMDLVTSHLVKDVLHLSLVTMTPVLLLMTVHVTLPLVSYLDVLTHLLVTMTHLRITTTDLVPTQTSLTTVMESVSMTTITTAYVMNSKRSDVLTQQRATILPAPLTTMDLVRMTVTDVQTHLHVTLIQRLR